MKTGNGITQTGYGTISPNSWPLIKKFLLQTGINQTGNGIISPISWPLIKKLILQKVSNFYNGVQNWCWKEEMELSKQEMELYLLLPNLKSNLLQNVLNFCSLVEN